MSLSLGSLWSCLDSRLHFLLILHDQRVKLLRLEICDPSPCRHPLTSIGTSSRSTYLLRHLITATIGHHIHSLTRYLSVIHCTTALLFFVNYHRLWQPKTQIIDTFPNPHNIPNDVLTAHSKYLPLEYSAQLKPVELRTRTSTEIRQI
jgi:hypothetical protein